MQLSRYVRTFLGPDSNRTAFLFFLLSLSVIAWGVFHAAVLRWLSDDIFISFRYIDQWFAGNGLVYNPGEYVEGYTHPLWLLLLSAWRFLGFDMISGSMLFGVMSQGLLLTTLVYASWRMAGRARWSVPAAAAAVALHHDASVWATSGLETGLYAFLVTAAVVMLVLPGIDERPRLLFTGGALVLATLTRPDGVLFLATMGLVVIAREWARGSDTSTIRKRTVQYALPSLIFIPYALWKLAYYGNLLPNTYYAKSGGGTHYEQGFTYVWLFLQGYPSSLFLIASLVALAAVFKGSGTLKARLAGIFADARLALSSVSLLFVAVYVVGFVARVGGDFMYARFLIPIVPLIYLSAEAAVRSLFMNKPRVMMVLLVVVPLTVGTLDAWSRDRLFTQTESGEVILADGNTGIIDEHYFWTRPFTEDGGNAIRMLRGIGRTLHRYFDGLQVRILIRGQASLAYESRVTEVIENWGLTDPFIAHMKIGERGRVGHEKAAPMDYITSRRIHFFFFKDFTPSDTSFYRIVRFDLPFGWSSAEMHFYDRDLMGELRRRFPDEITFVDFEQYLDEYLAGVDERSREELEQDLERFKDYYFNHNYDAERERRFLEALKGKRGR